MQHKKYNRKNRNSFQHKKDAFQTKKQSINTFNKGNPIQLKNQNVSMTYGNNKKIFGMCRVILRRHTRVYVLIKEEGVVKIWYMCMIEFKKEKET